MTTKVMIINFGPKPINVKVKGGTIDTRRLVAPHGMEINYVYSTQKLEIEEMEDAVEKGK